MSTVGGDLREPDDPLGCEHRGDHRIGAGEAQRKDQQPLERTDQAAATGASTVAVGCPFCLTMFSDGIKDRKKEESMAALDIAEIVWKSMDLEQEKPPVDVCAPPAS